MQHVCSIMAAMSETEICSAILACLLVRTIERIVFVSFHCVLY